MSLWLLLLCEERNCLVQNAVIDSDEVASFRQELNGVGGQSQIGVVIFRPVSESAVGKLVRQKVFVSFLKIAMRLLLKLLISLRDGGGITLKHQACPCVEIDLLCAPVG